MAESVASESYPGDQVEATETDSWKNRPMPERPLRVDVLHIFAVTNFAFAYPILDHMGYDPWFYIVERATAIDVVLLALTVSILLPALLSGVRFLAQLASPAIGNLTQAGIVAGVLISGTVHTVARRSDSENLLTYSAIAIIVCIFATWLYLFLQPVQFFVSVLSISVVAVPIYFVTMTEASRIVFPDRQEAVSQPLAEAPDVPIVFVVVDELPTTSLLDADMMIDRELYPNLAELADDSYWFRHASTISPSTMRAVPALLTGYYPDYHSLPHAPEHPDNIFSLFSETHELNVAETVTHMCDNSYCESSGLSASDRLDLMRRGAIGMNVRTALAEQNRADHFREFAASAGQAGHTQLSFHHSLLPHAPWWYFPSGIHYTDDISQPLEPWGDDWLAAHNYQRHLLQVQYLDELMGELIDELKSAGIYDDSLIVFTSDHGASFQTEYQYRVLNETTAADILNVPLIIKLPGQSEGIVSDRNVQLIDVLPTIADALEIEIPWDVDGVSAIDDSIAAPNHKTALLHHIQELMILDPEIPGFQDSLDHKLALFGDGTSPNGLYTFGRYSTIVGEDFESMLEVDSSEVRIELDNRSALDEVDPTSRFVPALLTGTIIGDDVSSSEPLHLAVAINGRVEAVGRVFEDDGESRFSMLVPEDALNPGENNVEFGVVQGSEESPSLQFVESTE